MSPRIPGVEYGVPAVMTADDRRELDVLRDQVPCAKGHCCIGSALSDLCRGRFHRELDILECLESPDPACGFARPFGCTVVCACPLRKFIARNLDRWSLESTAVLRREE